jgi:hypothetical protein
MNDKTQVQEKRSEKAKTKKSQKKTNKLTNRANSDTSNFLMQEYERLSGIRTESDLRASRRFDFYLTLTTALVGAYILLLQSKGGIVLPTNFETFVAIAWFFFGSVTFTNMTWASVFNLDIFRAQDEIRDYFIEKDDELEKYLYFRKPPTKVRGLLMFIPRFLKGGSEKLVVGTINSIVLTYLLNSFIFGSDSSSVSGIQFLVLIIAFVILLTLHVIYVRVMYKYY